MQRKLEFQADRIETVLRLHRIEAQVTGGTVTPRWVRFQVLPGLGAKISRIRGLSEELACALGAAACRVSRQGRMMAVEIPRPDPQPVRLLPLLRQCTAQSSLPPITATLGLGEDGAPLLVRLPSPDVAHILVAGATGSGKTALLQTIILSLALTNPIHSLAFVLVAPQARRFRAFEALPHLARPVIGEVNEAWEAFQSLVRLMEWRSRLEWLGRQPRVVIVVDEMADLLMVGGKPLRQALTRLTQRGREAGIHVVAATQKPTSDVLGPLVKANFPVRLVGRVTSAQDARTATGWSGTGAERLLGRGDFVAVAEGRVIRFQAAYVTAVEVEDALHRLRTFPDRPEDGRGTAASSPLPNPSLPPVTERLGEMHLWVAVQEAMSGFKGYVSKVWRGRFALRFGKSPVG